jgi:hypothetical protein
MIAMSKRSLIFESVATIQIGVHPVGVEPDQHVVHVVPRVLRTTTIHEVPTRSKLGPCSQDEVPATSDHSDRSSSWAASFSLQQTTLK